MILVGDIGGTNARLALAERKGKSYRLLHLERHETPEDMPALVAKYLRKRKVTPEAAALCGAGPVRDDGSIDLTNNNTVLVPKKLAKAAGLKLVHVVNDFEALAHSIPVLGAKDLKLCGKGKVVEKAPRLVIGAGTGLGVGGLMPTGKKWIALPAEGGHVDLAPVDEEEHEIWLKLRAAHGPQSAESILSGPGLERLHAAVCGEKLDAPDVAKAASGGNEDALRTVRLFTRWFGRVSGNAALTLGARGGVYIGGGIVPGWGKLFDKKEFRAGFEAKAGFEEWLGKIPAWIMMHPEPTLLGLARLAESA